MTNGKQRGKEAWGHLCKAKEMPFLWYHHVHHGRHSMSHLLSLQKFVFANCQAYELGLRNQLIISPLTRSVIDSAGEILPKLLLGLLVILSIICFTSALHRYSGGPETSIYQTLMMHRKKYTLPYTLLFNCFHSMWLSCQKAGNICRHYCWQVRLHTRGKSAE